MQREKKEIFYCNLTVIHKGKRIIIPECIYKDDDNGHYWHQKNLAKYGIKEKVKVEKMEIIHSMGFEILPSDGIEVTKSDETRNKITGAYE